MRTIVLLAVFGIFSLPTVGLAHKKCSQVFISENKSSDPLLVSAYNIHNAIVDLPVFGSSRRARAKEWEHMKSDLDSLSGKMMQIREKFPEMTPFFEKWTRYNNYWEQKLKEYLQLPEIEQKKLLSSLELPLSLGIKHLISFLEASNHKRWKLGRLEHILNATLDRPEVDLETALFLTDRATRRYFSRWEFIRCRY